MSFTLWSSLGFPVSFRDPSAETLVVDFKVKASKGLNFFLRFVPPEAKSNTRCDEMGVNHNHAVMLSLWCVGELSRISCELSGLSAKTESVVSRLPGPIMYVCYVCVCAHACFCVKELRHADRCVFMWVCVIADVRSEEEVAVFV